MYCVIYKTFVYLNFQRENHVRVVRSKKKIEIIPTLSKSITSKEISVKLSLSDKFELSGKETRYEWECSKNRAFSTQFPCLCVLNVLLSELYRPKHAKCLLSP